MESGITLFESVKTRVIRVIRVPIQTSETLEKETMKHEG